MDRVRNEEVLRRAGIKRELASRADERVLRWSGHVERMDEYRMARRMLMEVEYEVDRSLSMDGWCEAGLGQQRNDGGCCASMRERKERLDNPGAYVTE